ncbi:MAG: hypothetical protein ACOC7P_00710 [Chloroflexota bacterium]
MPINSSEYSSGTNEPFLGHVERYCNSLLKWDLEDLDNDVGQLRKITQSRFEIPVSERIRFSWRSKLEEQVRRYKELEEMSRFLDKRTTPWELFWSPLKNIPSQISESDDRAQKLAIIDRWVSIFWSDCISSYLFGMFPATILLSASCIELMLDGVALRDDERLYEQIKGKPGGKKLPLFLLEDRIKSKTADVFDKRAKIIAHGIQIIEIHKKRWDILTHTTGWDDSVPSSDYEGAQILYEFKSLAQDMVKSAMEVLSHLEKLSLKP